MSFSHPNADAQHLITQAFNSRGLGNLGREENRAVTMNMTPEQHAQWLKQREKLFATPPQWTGTDTVLTGMGYNVNYTQGNKSISRYVSNFAQAKINARQIDVPDEKTLLAGVTEVVENFDLKNTTLDSLGTIKKIGGSLYIDTASGLKSLGDLKEVGGSIVVYGKNKLEIDQFLKKINFPMETLGKKIRTVLRYI